MALAVHQQSSIFPATRDRILFLTAGVVLLTIVINGTTAKPLINLLGEETAASVGGERVGRGRRLRW